MQNSFSFEQVFALAEGFFQLLEGMDSFFFEVHTFYVPDQLGNFVPFTGSLVSILIGGGLTFLLTFRFIKFVTDIIL